MAPERDDAHDPHGGAPERGLHPRVHRRLRRGARGRDAVFTRGGRENHRRPRRGDARDGARVCDRAARGDLLHARDHRARLRRRQHLVALESRPHDRPPRLRVDRAQRASRPEQRPGAERLRREPHVPAGLPGDRRPGDPTEVLGGLGRRSAGDAGVPARPDDERAPRRAREGPLPDRREPGPDRAQRPPRRGRPRKARLPGLAGHLPARHDPQVRGRRLPGLVVRREGRHLHEHRAPDQPRPRGGAASRRGEGRPRDRPAHGEGTRCALARVPRRRVGLGRARRPRARLVRRSLRPPRGERAPVARAGDGPPGHAVPVLARAGARWRARASSSRSSTSVRSRSPTPSTRSSSPPAGRSTTTTRRR